MSHVDDGTLHAYVDGELTPVERARLEAHVAECAACRNRLEEERALIERASGLLGLAQPPERAAPPIHQLRRPSIVWRLRVPVTWAATVVLALGIGYYAGDRTYPHSAPQPLAAADSTPTDVATRPHDAADAVATAPPRRRNAQPPAPAPARPQPTPEVKAAERVADVASRRESMPAAASGVIAIRPRDTNRPAPAPAPAPRVAQTERAVEEGAVTTGAAAARRDDASPPLVATEWPIIRRGPARQILGAEPMGVPGLAVRNIRRSPTDDVVLVEQAIDSTTVIQLFQQRVESDGVGRLERSNSLRAQGAYVGRERLARFIGGVRVEIAGPLSADSLNCLLEQVKAIGP